MKILCVIPARLGSTRLPRKPLAMIGDKPMVQHTYEKAKLCQDLTKVVVATDSEEIADVVRQLDGDVEMTSPDIKTGSDRVAEVAKRYPEMDVIVNLQGDEPFIKPNMLSQLVQPFIQGENPEMSTLAYPLNFETEYHDPNIVKVIMDAHQNAIYFSRAATPHFRQESKDATVLHHMGLYAFSRQFLQEFTRMPQTPLEIAESLEQLRAIENGHKIRVCKIDDKTLEINTPEELMQAQALV